MPPKLGICHKKGSKSSNQRQEIGHTKDFHYLYTCVYVKINMNYNRVKIASRKNIGLLLAQRPIRSVKV